MSTITLDIDGRRLTGWTEVAIERGIDRAAGAFSLSIAEPFGKGDNPALWRVPPGARVAVGLDGQVMVEGYVDRYRAGFGPRQLGVAVQGRSATADLVDCSAVVPGGRFTDRDLGQIARALAEPFGIEVAVEADVGEPFAQVQIEPGETVIEVIQRLGRHREVLATDDAAGRLRLVRPGDGPSTESIRQGAPPLIAAQAELSWAERYSEYRVVGQQALPVAGDADQARGVAGRVSDPAVSRYRPRLIVAEAEADPATARIRAETEARRRAGEGMRATVTLSGWLRDGGQPWQPGDLVPLDLPALGLSGASLMIVSARYQVDKRGFTVDLSLSPASAFTPEPAAAPGIAMGGGTAEPGMWDDVVPVRG